MSNDSIERVCEVCNQEIPKWRATEQEVGPCAMLWRAFDRPVWRKPMAFAADAEMLALWVFYLFPMS
jgi:hypothetical protein